MAVTPLYGVEKYTLQHPLTGLDVPGEGRPRLTLAKPHGAACPFHRTGFSRLLHLHRGCDGVKRGALRLCGEGPHHLAPDPVR